ncbi:MAG: NAD(+) synthase [Oscillospiraceae bacterium]|jgi:NAD+ synthase (glutamine-hydrolysing)|nr:NAD(+) synthase [Oscillospiraceae bacterium]
MNSYGFVRAACVTFEVTVANPRVNADKIIEHVKKAAQNNASVILFPELCLTAYTCGDLFLQRVLIRSAEEEFARVMRETSAVEALVCVGLPIPFGSALYNCAAIFCKGELLGIVPKMNIPNYSEFYEARHFSRWPGGRERISFAGQETFVGDGLLFRCEDFSELVVGAEICEDLWVPLSPSAALARSGATLILNPSASDEVIGKSGFRRTLVSAQSAKLICAYMYADAGVGESPTDLVFAGHNLVAENGAVLAESKKYTEGILYADIDIERLAAERRRTTTFALNGFGCDALIRDYSLVLDTPAFKLNRHVERRPFVPSDKDLLGERCEEILTMQSQSLATRILRSGAKTVELGLSGGLDSTLALIVCARAMDRLGRPRTDIVAVTMPGFGTTKRTLGNAEALAEAYGAELLHIDITDAVVQHFKDIGHNAENRDVTYENAQARERTQILMDLANQRGGFVVGTGDLSELALGWSTYNGDHMSMYGVNCGVPKTLVRYIVEYEAGQSGAELSRVLNDILDTPVSPELLPSDQGRISQKTEDIIGPYELHDFFLYYFVRFGFSPKKIIFLGAHAFAGEYDSLTIRKWLRVFIERFFRSQFKRSCLPDGPKIGTVTLSPRGDWRMPSDADAALWLSELDSAE